MGWIVGQLDTIIAVEYTQSSQLEADVVASNSHIKLDAKLLVVVGLQVVTRPPRWSP